MRFDIRPAFDLDDEDEDLAPPCMDDADPEAPVPEDGEDDLPPWHHPDPWTMAQAEAAYWERVEALTDD